MLGGTEPPCRPLALRKALFKKTGRRCPRVELDPANEPAAELAGFLIDERFRAFAPEYLRAAGLTVAGEHAVLMRVRRVLGYPEVVDALYPEQKKLREKSRGKARG